ncbi:IS66 family transposase [Alkaliphilus serpentinus]|uniref:IS66 family transposase n=1 Tax=Alkaliphilus serpentinus TaxID=1482731 RepID=A0A833M8L5_9FIRM|nr:IS66 family transposase [Alkaliphilus serpentinus]KAB3526305.1 IS66 family transposase [Alkaliphilus serpentinus]
MKTIENSTKNQLNNDNSAEESIEALQNKCALQEQQIEELTVKLAWYEEQIRKGAQQKYGASSEKTPDDQLSFFNEAEKAMRPNLKEPDLEEITYKRRKAKGINHDKWADLPVEVIEYYLPKEEESCPECNHSLHIMSKEIRKELKIIPAQVKIVEHVRHVYSCRQCEKDNIKTPVITAKAPAPVVPGSFVSPSLMAFVMNRKYSEAIPLYRQEQQFINFGIELSRQNLANWMIKGADWLKFVYDRLHDRLLKETYIHADETTLQVLSEDKKSATSKSYMWLYASGKFGPQILLYEYTPSRASKHPKAFLQGFKGYLQTDGYQAYNDVDDVAIMGCFAHARRGFVDALKALPKNAAASATLAKEGRDYCNQLFYLERGYLELSPEERYIKRLEHSKPVLEAFLVWLNTNKPKVLPKSGLGKAITYCLNQWNKLETFLKDGSIEISNNRAERAIKPFVIGRKNWLFSKSPNGAAASAIIYSIVETAKANNLSPFHYLEYLFERLPNIDNADSNKIDDLLPWSESIPQSCKVSSKN